jgi:hypothetical protein
MHQAARIGPAGILLWAAGSPANAFDGAPGVNPPSLGIGINRVPCDVPESQTPVPFVGLIEDLVHL